MDEDSEELVVTFQSFPTKPDNLLYQVAVQLVQRFKCCQCQETYASREELKNHIAAQHLRYFPYRCGHCLFACVSIEETEQHQQNFHHQLPINFVMEGNFSAEFHVEQMAKSSTVYLSDVPVARFANHSTEEIHAPAAKENSVFKASPTVRNPTIDDSRRLSQNAWGTQRQNKQETIENQWDADESPSEVKIGSQERSEISRESEVTNTNVLRSNDSPLEETNGHLETQRPKEICCKLCGKFFISHKKSHVLSVHMKAKAYLCNLCSYGGAQLSNVRAHISKHHKGDSQAMWTDQRALFRDELKVMMEKCFKNGRPPRGMPLASVKSDECSKTVGQSNKTSQGHKRVGKMNYCSLCDRWLSSQRGQHVRDVHMDDKRFACNYCSLSSPRTQAIRNHCLRIHPNEKLTWTNEASIDDHATVVEAIKRLCYRGAMCEEWS